MDIAMLVLTIISTITGVTSLMFTIFISSSVNSIKEKNVISKVKNNNGIIGNNIRGALNENEK